LGSRDFEFIELEAHTLDRLRRVERQADPLFARRSRASARSCPETESRLNRVARSFRSNLDFAQFLQIEPLAIIWCIAGKRTWTENAFPHDFIIARSQCPTIKTLCLGGMPVSALLSPF
jgi:hypothetical protein